MKLAVEALSPSQRGRGIAPSNHRRHGMLNRATAALFDVFLEAWRQRQSVDQVEADTAKDGELAEVTQRVHAAQTRERTQQTYGRRRQAWTSRSKVVEAASGQRLGDCRLDELSDGGAAVTLRLRVEAEHTCTQTCIIIITSSSPSYW